MRLIDADVLRKNSKMLYSIHAFEPIEGYTQDQLDAAPTIDAVSKDKVITCVTGIIEGYSDAHIITCAVCGLPVPDYGADETVECRWCKAKSHSEAYVPCGPGHCTTSEARKAKTFDRLFSSQHCGAKIDASDGSGV